LLWLGWGGGASWIATAMAAIPGLLLVASGVSNLLWPGDPRQRHFGALGALAGILVGLISALWLGVAGALLMIALSAASGWAIGSLGLRLVERWEDVPEPLASVRAAFEVAVDSAVLAQMALRAPARGMRGNNERVAGEVHAALEMYRERGWVETPAAYHVTPPPLEKPELRRRRARGVDFEHLQFESGYEPHDGEPGRERWLSYAPCRTGHAWVLRKHDPAPETGSSRPWLICIHGYQMGTPVVDFGGGGRSAGRALP
jgi:hypothetical protein